MVEVEPPVQVDRAVASEGRLSQSPSRDPAGCREAFLSFQVRPGTISRSTDGLPSLVLEAESAEEVEVEGRDAWPLLSLATRWRSSLPSAPSPQRPASRPPFLFSTHLQLLPPRGFSLCKQADPYSMHGSRPTSPLPAGPHSLAPPTTTEASSPSSSQFTPMSSSPTPVFSFLDACLACRTVHLFVYPSSPSGPRPSDSALLSPPPLDRSARIPF